MKSAIIWLFVSFYFLVSVGITTNLHFCQDELKSFSFDFSNQDSCCGEKEMDDGCCKNIKLILKKSNTEQINSIVEVPFLAKAIFVDNSSISFSYQSIVISENKTKITNTHPPNYHTYPTLFIRFCNFRI